MAFNLILTFNLTFNLSFNLILISGKTHISLTWRLFRENRGGAHISLTWRLLSAVSMNETSNQPGFSTLSVNGVKSCDSPVIVS